MDRTILIGDQQKWTHA